MNKDKNRVCPWYLGYTLILPFRKYKHDPEKILGQYIKKGMYVMDYGCAMGYFSIPMAKMAGETGKVYCVDIQDKMLENLNRRAQKYDVSDIIVPLKVGENYKPAELNEKLDFVLLFAVVHEVPDKAKLFSDIYAMVKQGGKVLISEPAGHVSPDDFAATVNVAMACGFRMFPDGQSKKGLSVVLSKNHTSSK